MEELEITSGKPLIYSDDGDISDCTSYFEDIWLRNPFPKSSLRGGYDEVSHLGEWKETDNLEVYSIRRIP